MNKCNYCNIPFPCLTIIDFKNMIWLQGKNYQTIKDNEQVVNYELYLCHDCKLKIFSKSVPLIKYSQELFDTLCKKNNQEIKPFVKPVVQNKLKVVKK